MHSTIESDLGSGLRVVKVGYARLEELFITATLRDGDDCRRLFGNAHRVVREAGATIVAEDVFGIPPADQSALATGHEHGNHVDWPVTWLDAGACANPGLAGVQVHAIQGVPVERIERNGRIIGSVFDDGFARHCRLGDLWPPNVSASPEQQARATFELAEAALRSVGMDFTNVVRTWFYLDRILAWYRPFNRVRDEFFRERKVFDGLVPASTGIGGANPARAALMADAYAAQPNDGCVKIVAVPSPLQYPALEYGSSFSRAIELGTPDHRRLWISGTASIDPDGRTIHVGNLVEQIDLTMKVVVAILESRGMSWADATRAVAYVKERAGARMFQEYCATHNLARLPVVTSENDICRDELLFEIEVDACQRRGSGSGK